MTLATCPKCCHQIPPACPECASTHVCFNGRRGENRLCICRGCGHQFVAGGRSRISSATAKAIDVLLEAGVEVSAISKALAVSRQTIYNRRNALGLA